jgi:hypothetical protein
MMRRLAAFVTWMLIAWANAHADDAPRTMLRAHLEPAGTVSAGSTVQLVVDALTTTWFTAAPEWPLFDLHDAYVTLPDENAQNLNETVGGVTWFGVRRVYRIVPRTAGTFDVPSIRITLHPGGTDAPVAVDTPALRLRANLPPGAEGMTSFFPAPKVTATQRIEPANGEHEVGSTVTRIVTQRAEGTEAMLIPPIPYVEIDGLRRDMKPPLTRNITAGRGDFVAGERTDTVTYSVERRGRHTLPPIDIEWWNTTTQQREILHLPAVTFDAHAAHEQPLWDIPVDALSGAARHTVIFVNARDAVIACVMLACIVAAVAWYSRVLAWMARLRQRVADACRRRREGEPAAWRALKRAVGTGAMQRVVPALYRWLDANPRFTHPAQLSDIEEARLTAMKPLTEAVNGYYASGRKQDRAPRIRLRRRTGWRTTHPPRPPALPPLNEDP